MRVARTVTRGVRVYTFFRVSISRSTYKVSKEHNLLCDMKMKCIGKAATLFVPPTHPICSMIYGSTGATHFDQLAKILTGYEITGVRSIEHDVRSSGIFMGILFIAVGSLFKITAVPFRAAVGVGRPPIR